MVISDDHFDKLSDLINQVAEPVETREWLVVINDDHFDKLSDLLEEFKHLMVLSLYGRPVQPALLVCMPGDWMR